MSFDVNDWIKVVHPTHINDHVERPDCPDCGEEEIVTIFWEHDFFKHNHPKKIRECVELPTWLVTMISGYSDSPWEIHEGLVARMGDAAEGPAAGIWQFCKMQSASDDWGDFFILPDHRSVSEGDKFHVHMSLPGTEEDGRFNFALCYQLVSGYDIEGKHYFDLKLIELGKED